MEAAPTNPTAKFLIVDDVKENRYALEKVFKTYLKEAELLAAPDGASALQLALSESPDVIVLDVHMPAMDGYEVCRRLKADDRTAAIPVLMVSAFLTEGHQRAAGIDCGADGYLCKPFDVHELVALVKSLLRLHRTENRLRNYQAQLEQELNARTLSLQASEKHWKSLFKCSPDGILICDPQGALFGANPALCQLAERSLPELVGSSLYDLVLPEYHAAVRSMFPHWEDGTMRTIETYIRRRADGASTSVEMIANAFEYEGQPALLMHLHDTSERHKTEDALNQAQKLESVGILAGGIAHDFNNILTGIIGNLSFAAIELGADHPVSDPIADAEKSALRARMLTQQLLTLAKGGAPIRKVAELRDIIKDAASFVLTGSNLCCQCDITDDLWTVEVDSGQISQVIENLTINASHAMPEGGILEIGACNIILDQAEVALLPSLFPGHYVKASVKDSGCGIPEEHLSSIFDPYFTTKSEGTGLGLATAYSIVRKHDGLLTVDSTVGEGTTFTIYLPASEKPAEPAPAALPEPIMGTGHVLAMDDEEVIRKVLSRSLGLLGYTTVCVHEGVAAVAAYADALAAGKPFDAVILDLTVPGGMGGEATLHELLKLDPDVKAIVSSGYSTSTAMSSPTGAGFKGVVVKPYDVRQLSHVLSAVISGDQLN
jgi:two-component system cell cycle sensor histidine kinase/response regulator CckA